MRAEDSFARVESESGIIATLIRHPEFSFNSEHLLPNHFTNKENRYLYQAICALARRGIDTIDPYNIIECLASSEATRPMAEELNVDQLFTFIETSEPICRNSVEEYNLLVDSVLNAAFRRDTFRQLRECEAICLDPNEKEIEQKIYRALDEVMVEFSTTNDLPQYKDVIDGYWSEIQDRQGTGYAGIPFKFPALNDYVTIERGELVIFAAQQKVGKSIMLLNCAVDLLRKGQSVLYIDSELSSRLFTARLLSHLSGVEYRCLTSGKYSETEAKRIEDAIAWMKQQSFTHIYMPFFDQQSIYTAVKRVNHIQPLDVIIVDYFKSTGNEMDAFQTYAAMGRCVDLIKNDIAGAMNIAAIGAAQATATNRLADSAKIARNASTIIMLMDKTAEEIEADGTECGNKKLVVSVNRNGMQHKDGEYIDLYFDGNRVLYEQAKQHVPITPF